MSNHISYTYLIGWSFLNKFYYGRRTAKMCNPSDLWNGYYTSSKVVKEYRKIHGEPDIIQIRQTFCDPKKCARWESKVLEKIDAQHDDRYLNMKNGDDKWDRTGISNGGIKHPMYGKPGLKGELNPMYGVTGEKHPMYNRRGYMHPAYGVRGSKHHLSKKYKVTSPSGDVYNVYGLTQFCREHNLDQAHMVKVSKKIYSQHKGWLCEVCE